MSGSFALQVNRAISFCAGHRLLQYEGNCRNVHGHNFKAVIHVKGSVVNKSGMIVDFNVIRDTVKEWIDVNWDHGFLANAYDFQMRDFLVANNQKFFVLEPEVMNKLHGYNTNQFVDRDSEFKSFDAKTLQTSLCNPTVENLSLLLAEEARKLLMPALDAVCEVSATVYESENGWVQAL